MNVLFIKVHHTFIRGFITFIRAVFLTIPSHLMNVPASSQELMNEVMNVMNHHHDRRNTELFSRMRPRHPTLVAAATFLASFDSICLIPSGAVPRRNARFGTIAV